MARVRRTGTEPELRVRSIAHRLGFRFRVNRSNLPGSPDLVFPKYRAVIFVHGCFWHRHIQCHRASTPTTRASYWVEKFNRNVARDSRVKRELRREGWRVLVLWECEINEAGHVSRQLLKFLR
ncbi:very short patch repair endonuclease [Bradyrhizobium sp.]|uniref:very short patch repair endonuclease n=1 Tax=Bradyrhizobium sp. TaxID=376 RepID=UPI0025C3A56D|nr:very short patch repair endonuclease [Bradyrhizobium sp.]